MAKRKEATLDQIAEEMNNVMAYGCDEDGKLVDPNDQIDTDLSEKALLKVIKERAKEDLRPADEGSFSPEVWDWFIDNGLAPEDNGEGSDMDENDGEPAQDGSEADDADEDDDSEPDEAPEKPRQAPPAKVKRDSKPNKAEKPQEGDSKARKTEKRANTQAEGKKAEKAEERPDNPDSTRKPKRTGTRPSAMAKGGNENFAVELVKNKSDFQHFYSEFVDLYKECKPEADEKYVLSRAKIYWNIAHKKLGKNTPPAELEEDKRQSGKGKQADSKREDNADTGRSNRAKRR